MAKHGLGKGLDAILGASQSAFKTKPAETAITQPQSAEQGIKKQVESSAEKADEKQGVVLLPLEKVVPNPSQPRHNFEENALKELVASIKEHGIIQPLIVRKLPSGNYELIAGERRWRAAKEVGLKSVPVIIREASEEQIMELSLVENLQRQDLNPIEEAKGYATLASHFGLTQEKIAEKVGKARASVANALRLLELPAEIKNMLTNGSISAGHAKVLLSVPIDEEKILLARQTVKEGLSVRALEKIVAKRLAVQKDVQNALNATQKPSIIEAHTRHLVDILQRHFGTSVRISMPEKSEAGKNKKGTLEIDFFSNDDLDRIIKLFGISEL